LAEKGADGGELIMPPMFQQALGDGRDPPVVWVGDIAPIRDPLPNEVDFFGEVVPLLGGRDACGVEVEFLLG
jgi:hypothetical protein